jgi:hypothetical protein
LRTSRLSRSNVGWRRPCLTSEKEPPPGQKPRVLPEGSVARGGWRKEQETLPSRSFPKATWTFRVVESPTGQGPSQVTSLGRLNESVFSVNLSWGILPKACRSFCQGTSPESCVVQSCTTRLAQEEGASSVHLGD